MLATSFSASETKISEAIATDDDIALVDVLLTIQQRFALKKR